MKIAFRILLLFLALGSAREAQAQLFGYNVYSDNTSLLHTGRMEVGLELAGLITTSSITLTAPSGAQTNASTQSVYVSPALFYGLMVTPEIELRLMAFYQFVNEVEGSTTFQQDSSFGAALQGLYYFPLPLGFAFYLGAGAGAYGGTVQQPSGATGVSYDASEAAGIAQLLGGLLVQPGQMLILRAGLRGDFLFGSQSPGNPALGSSASFFDAHGLIDISASLRFN